MTVLHMPWLQGWTREEDSSAVPVTGTVAPLGPRVH